MIVVDVIVSTIMIMMIASVSVIEKVNMYMQFILIVAQYSVNFTPSKL